jgi:hypothetical protein
MNKADLLGEECHSHQPSITASRTSLNIKIKASKCNFQMHIYKRPTK